MDGRIPYMSAQGVPAPLVILPCGVESATDEHYLMVEQL